MRSLTKVEKAKTKVVFATVIVALLMKRAGELSGLSPDTKLPAVTQCVNLIDELVAELDDEIRDTVLQRIDKNRSWLTTKTSKLDVMSGLVASIEVLCGPTFRSRPGTRFDYLRQVLRHNISEYGSSLNVEDADRKKFKKYFLEAIFK